MEKKYIHTIEIRYLDYQDYLSVHVKEIEGTDTLSSPIDDQLQILLKQIKDLGFLLKPGTKQLNSSEARIVRFIPGHRIVDIDYVFTKLKEI